MNGLRECRRTDDASITSVAHGVISGLSIRTYHLSFMEISSYTTCYREKR